jgi:hypothetical protein
MLRGCGAESVKELCDAASQIDKLFAKKHFMTTEVSIK